ncbi:hypothetical protein D3Y55_21215 [Mesorhizobium sp. DCY119]|nr:hypothetical protein D3Y55_21215 [Mesorhizobium sp. DCY119]
MRSASMAVGATNITFTYFRDNSLKGHSKRIGFTNREILFANVPMVKLQDDRIWFATINARMTAKMLCDV